MVLLKKHGFSIFYLSLFLFLLPVASSIDFWHNDDWAYYPAVENILRGIFKLNPLVTPTFYSIGLPAALFSAIFGLDSLPGLTLAVSVACLFILHQILVKDLKLYGRQALLVSLLFGVCPLFVFTTWGFLTDNYFLFYFLVSIYCLNRLKDRYSIKNAGLSLVFITSAYFSRQLGLIIPLAYLPVFLKEKKYKEGALMLGIFLFLGIYHFAFFPKSDHMLETQFTFGNLTYFRYIFSLLWSIGLTVVVFTMPLFISYFIEGITSLGQKKTFLVLLLATLILVLSHLYFKNIGWINEHLYFFDYTVGREGFFPDNLHGTKHGHIGAQLIYPILENVAKILLSTYVALAIVKKSWKNMFDQYTALAVIYFGVLLLSVKVYDRYLIPLIVLGILTIVKSQKGLRLACLSIWVILLGFYSYNFTLDYLRTNSYVYNKAGSLMTEHELEPRQIVATDLWKYKYTETDRDIVFKFTYDDPSQQNYSTDFELLEKYTVDYPFNFWRGKNEIYLYRKLGVPK